MSLQSIPVLSLVNLSSEDAELVARMSAAITTFEQTNARKLAYYEGKQRLEHLGIAIPPSFRDLEVVVGWAGMTVDILEERLDWYGWASDDDTFGLGDLYQDNALDVDAGKAHLDALIYGTSFVVVGAGDAGEPSTLITTHSPRSMTGIWDARSRRLKAALAVSVARGQTVEATLYKPDETVQLSRENGMRPWTVVDRDRHRLGRVPVVQFENRARSDVKGRSEITTSVRSYTDQAVRTMLGMEVNREFHSAPQRYAINIAEDSFTDAGGNAVTGWETIMGRVWAVPYDPENPDRPEPKLGQFTPASPAPYLDQVRGLGQLLAAEAGIPPSYLGFQTDNPASADAILRSEARLVKRAERRQKSFGRSWLEVGRLALLVRDGAIPEEFREVSAKWRDPATPTRSAAADEATKLVAAGVLPPDSQVTYDRIGLAPAEQRQLDADKRRAAGSGVVQALQQAAERVRGGDAG